MKLDIEAIKAQALGILNCSQASQSKIHEAVEHIPALCDEVQKLTAHVERLQDDINSDSLTIAYMKGVEDGKAKSKPSATGPWNYDDPPPGDKVIIAIYNSKYFIKPLLFIGKWDSKVQKDVRVICWARINMPEGMEG